MGASMRVNTNNINVEVNDRGDYITLYNDMSFLQDILSFADGLDELERTYRAKAEQCTDDADERAKLLFDFHNELAYGINSLFGDDACKKVFGDGVRNVVPNVYQVLDFVEKLSPFIDQLIGKLNADVNKNVSKSVNKSDFKPVGYMGSAPKSTSAFDRLRGSLEERNE